MESSSGEIGLSVLIFEHATVTHWVLYFSSPERTSNSEYNFNKIIQRFVEQ